MKSPRTRRPVRMGIAVVCAALIAGAAFLAAPSDSGASKLKLPKDVTRELAYTMYGEQVESADTIGELVDGKMIGFEVLDSDVTSETAELELRVTLTDGTSRRGVMNLVKAGEHWYFESIARTGDTEDEPGYETDPDIGVLNTMLAEQSKNSRLITKLVEGQYKEVKVDEPKKGFRSTTIPVTFSGLSKSVDGKVTAVKRTQDGRPQWFIVSFR